MTDSDLLHSEPSPARAGENHVEPSGDDPLESSGDDAFWGADWDPSDHEPNRSRLTGPIAAWWRSVTEGRDRAAAVRVRRGTVADHDPDGALDGWPAEWSEERRPGVDPLLARLGGLAVVATLLVPVMLGFTSDSGDSDDGLGTIATPIDRIAERVGSVPDASSSSPAASASPESPTSDDSASIEEEASSLALGGAAAALTDPVTTTPACGADYEIAVGDFWIRIAAGADVDVDELLAVNGATSATPLYPGRTICLPEGASTPPPPTSAATAPSATTASGGTGSTASSSSRSAPAPTVAPTTTPPAPTVPPTTQPPLDAEGVQAVIRAVWPDELEERALEIAWRESNYRPTARNSCCYGVFQIYWNVHRSWLGDLGITSAEDLYDPTLNARAALALYERAGGWGPWGG